MNKYHLELKLRTDRQNTDGTFSIVLYLNLNKQVKYFTTNQRVLEEHWNPNKHEVSGKADNWARINSAIKNYKIRAETIINLANAENRLITTVELENILRSGYISNSYFDFVEGYIKKYGSRYKDNTLRNFKSELKTIRSFRPNLEFAHINAIFWKQFEAFLLSKNHSQNTIHKYFKNLRKFLNQAVIADVIKENPLKEVRVKQTEGNFVRLNKEEVNKLDRLYHSGIITSAKQRKALQCFLFACYTGLRYSDVRDLKYKHLQNLNDAESAIIEKQIFKTRDVDHIPLNEKALKLIQPGGMPHRPVFHVFTNQVMNRTLKEIMELAGIDKKVSFHVARHTAATILLELSGNIEAVKKIMGHRYPPDQPHILPV